MLVPKGVSTCLSDGFIRNDSLLNRAVNIVVSRTALKLELKVVEMKDEQFAVGYSKQQLY